MSEILELKRLVARSKRIVFFGGAGVSTDSGIPDFRGSGGLYTTEGGFDVSPKEMLSIGYLNKNPEGFYNFYRNSMLYPNATPNATHKALAKLEKDGRLMAVITQNIDGLHQTAGSKKVIELHGSAHRNYCTRCKKSFSLDHILKSEGVPICDECGATVRPDVVLYGERLDVDMLIAAKEAIANADLLIVGGTSLTVQPAAGLVEGFGGRHFVIINKSQTPYDEYAELLIREPLSSVMERLV